MNTLAVVGDLVHLPEAHRQLARRMGIPDTPGKVVSITQGWAMVDRGPYGEIGVDAALLVPLILCECGHDPEAHADTVGKCGGLDSYDCPCECPSYEEYDDGED